MVKKFPKKVRERIIKGEDAYIIKNANNCCLFDVFNLLIVCFWPVFFCQYRRFAHQCSEMLLLFLRTHKTDQIENSFLYAFFYGSIKYAGAHSFALIIFYFGLAFFQFTRLFFLSFFASYHFRCKLVFSALHPPIPCFVYIAIDCMPYWHIINQLMPVLSSITFKHIIITIIILWKHRNSVEFNLVI